MGHKRLTLLGEAKLFTAAVHLPHLTGELNQLFDDLLRL